MLNDVIGGSRLLGVIQPGRTDGEITAESPLGKSAPLRRVGCAGRVSSYQEIDDGRLAITLTGIVRFAVIDEAITALPYRVASVSYDAFVRDLNAGFGEELIDREKLLSVLKAYLEKNNLSADWEAIQRASSESLINALSVMSPYGPEEKQALLEAADLKARAEVLMTLAEMELATRGGTGGTIQ